MVLLAKAVEATHCLDVWEHSEGWTVRMDASHGGTKEHTAPTLADALLALLRDLGIDDPWPSEERIDAAWQALNESEDNLAFLDGMRDHDDREAVIALLERGS